MSRCKAERTKLAVEARTIAVPNLDKHCTEPMILHLMRVVNCGRLMDESDSTKQS